MTRYGKCLYTDGSCYEGEWKEDQRCGWGVLKMVKGECYEGEWKDDRPNGTYFPCVDFMLISLCRRLIVPDVSESSVFHPQVMDSGILQMGRCSKDNIIMGKGSKANIQNTRASLNTMASE